MDKKTVNQQIINGLASKGINIAEIELNHLEAFADIMYKAINVIQCCKSDSELLCNKKKNTYEFDSNTYIGRKVGKSDI